MQHNVANGMPISYISPMAFMMLPHWFHRPASRKIAHASRHASTHSCACWTLVDFL
jgi:hypothetical protein